MELKKFNDQIWLTEVELDGYQVRGALILGERDAVLVDTLSHPRDMVPLLPLIPSHGDMGGPEIIRQNIAYLQVLSEGEVPDVFEPMTDFYRHTHGANIGFARVIFTPGKPRS